MVSSFEKQTRFSALAFHPPVIIFGTVKAEAFSQENLLSFALIGNFSVFVRLVISAVAVNTSTTGQAGVLTFATAQVAPLAFVAVGRGDR